MPRENLTKAIVEFAHRLEDLGLGNGYSYARLSKQIKASASFKPKQVELMTQSYERATLFLDAVKDLNLTPTQLQNMCEGAHFVIEGPMGDRFYEAMKNIPGARERASSHYTDTRLCKDMGVDVAEFTHALFGRATRNGRPVVWYQCENNGFGNFRSIRGCFESVLHFKDYLYHKMTKINLGPRFARSHITEHNPDYVLDPSLRVEVLPQVSIEELDEMQRRMKLNGATHGDSYFTDLALAQVAGDSLRERR